jgi:pyruvate-formate lyase-activating enzyme
MGSSIEKLTKLHLQAFGLSDYIIKQLVKGLDPITSQSGLKEYNAVAVANSIETRLANPKIQAKSRAKLQRVLTWLNGESNVIPVDFLKGLPSEKRIEVLYTRLQELEAEEQELTEETSKLLGQARKMVANK